MTDAHHGSVCPENSPVTAAGSALGWIGFWWGVLGVLAFIGYAIVRLVPPAFAPIEGGLTAGEWIAYGVCAVMFAYGEGVRGFQKQFAPRVAARAVHLAREPRVLHVLLAPLYCMAFFHATRSRLIRSYVLAVMITILVIGVRMLDQPWRGIVDGGVVVGLSWGEIAIAIYAYRAYRGRRMPVASDVPGTGT